MPSIVETFRQEHVQILALAEELERSADRQQMEAFRTQLLDHLDREDQLFYPRLEQAAGSDPRLRRILDVFAKDRDDVTVAARRYFEGVPRPAAAGRTGLPDYPELLKGLHTRILHADDTEEIAAEVVRFFESNPEVWAEPEQPTAFEDLVELIRGRIRKEETVLFRLHAAVPPC